MGLRSELIRWFDRHARDLPFRETRDPYAIWVSEVMLQQTRVDTVLPYYERFMRRFPTALSLAAAEEDEVMSLWSGLGYYRRARLLHRGVKEVAAQYGGEIPTAAAARRALPGIGRYTAGAIGSIAFDQPEPLVDGNVARVFSRLHGIATPLGQTVTERRLWEEAEKLVQGPRPGALNQALMELGATICSKSKPNCSQCPVAKHCVALATGRTEALPIPRRKPPPRPTPMVALLATTPRAHAVWLTRGQQSLFGGLWNLPMMPTDQVEGPQALLEQIGLRGRAEPAPALNFEHVLTHRRLQVALYRLEAQGKADEFLRPVKPAELGRLGLSSLTKKALRQGGFPPASRP